MEKSVPVKKGNTPRFTTPELQQQIVRLSHELEDCEQRLSDHLYVMDEIKAALTIAQECAQCLLSDNPFAAWNKVIEQKEKESEIFDELEIEDDDIQRTSLKEVKAATTIHQTKSNVTTLVTSEMRRQIADLKGQLDEYAACLREAFRDMLELESLNYAVARADEVKCVDQLDSDEARKKRRRLAEEDEESLGDL